MLKISKKFLFSILILTLLSGCSNQGQVSGVQDENLEPNNQLEIIFFDVGQGDSILINTPEDKQILIDGGPDNTILEKLNQYLDFGDKYIDIVVLTHPHADHVDGLVSVLERFEVGQVWLTGVVHTSSKYLEFSNLIKHKGIGSKAIFVCGPEIKKIEKNEEIKNAECVDQLKLENNIIITFLWPDQNLAGETVDNLNNSSIVFKLDYLDNSFLFTGDAEIEAEQGMIEHSSPEDLAVDVLKIGHHGSSSSSHQEFLDLVNPEYAIISVGVDNPYGHPSLRTIRRLERLGIQTFRTDDDGDIILESNGTNFDIYHL